jgi:enamine deaminase RidA (YjgF/YER057c/UK114 family)
MATLTHLNAERVPTSSAFSHAVAVAGDGRTVYVGGQNGVGPEGTIATGIRAQTVQALRNLEAVLAAAQTTLERVVNWNVLVVAGASLTDAFDAFTNPQFEIEIDAVAVADGEA